MTVPLAARDIAAAAGAVLVLGAVVSVVGTVIVPRNTGSRLTRLVTRVVNGLFRLICRPVSAYRRRDRIMAGQAAVILLGQIAVWLGAFYVGYALLVWPVTASIGVAFTSVGPALWTFGDPNAHGFFETARPRLGRDGRADHRHPADRLPAASVRRLQPPRERDRAAQLPGRACPRGGRSCWRGPTTRSGRARRRSNTLPEFYSQWERWAADVTESHVTYSPLAWFRSPSHEASWVTALLSVLDSAALYLALCPEGAPAVPDPAVPARRAWCASPKWPAPWASRCRPSPIRTPASASATTSSSTPSSRLQRGGLPDRARAGGRLAALRRLAGQLRAGRVRDRRGRSTPSPRSGPARAAGRSSRYRRCAPGQASRPNGNARALRG